LPGSADVHLPALTEDELEQMLARAKQRSGAMRSRHRRRSVAVFAALVIALGGTAAGLQAFGRLSPATPGDLFSRGPCAEMAARR
jgi:hypothetical protein